MFGAFSGSMPGMHYFVAWHIFRILQGRRIVTLRMDRLLVGRKHARCGNVIAPFSSDEIIVVKFLVTFQLLA
jgi:hypothetical protein